MTVLPISVEIIAPVLTDLRHCAHCETIFDLTEIGQRVHSQLLDEYPHDLKEDFEHLSAWLIELAIRYGNAIHIKLIDPQSLEGFFKCIRYWVRGYPAFIIAGHKEHIGWDKEALDRALHGHISKENLLT